METILFWFRRDLRLRDNVGLHQARTDADRLYTIYVEDPRHDGWKHACGDRLYFKLEAVRSLRESIRNHDGELMVRTGDFDEVIPRLADELTVDAVYWNRAYEPYERRRDEEVRDVLVSREIAVSTFKDQVLFEQDEILTQQNTPYKVFSPYARSWRNQPKPESVPSVDRLSEPELDAGEIPTVQQLGLSRQLDSIEWEPSATSAHRRFEAFLGDSLLDYDRNRDYPARDATSKCSPFLRFGLISPRTLYESCRERYREADRTKGIETFVDELIWREFYHQILYNFPRVATENFQEKYDGVEWEEHPEWFEAWKQGVTGYPIVDAAMRQLSQTGWMHNRLRMIVAMFLTKDCLIHWKHGETYFMNRLLDGDTAANNGGWQWSASTGTDAAPYFRLFNPISQSRKYDPEGQLIRRFCPELAELDDDDIHAPFECNESTLNRAGIQLGDTYPKPILDHQERREIAIEKFKRAAERAN